MSSADAMSPVYPGGFGGVPEQLAYATEMRVLVAGATGAVGTVLVPELRKSGIEVTPHVRPATADKHPMGKDREALICDLGDLGKLDAAMARCNGVACLVRPMRARFRAGGTYESSGYL